MLYTVYLHRLEELQKAYNRLAKKAAAIGIETSMTAGEPYTKEVKYYEFDSVNKCYTWNHKTAIIELVDVELNYPDYKIGEYELIAILDHTISDHENAIYKTNEAAEIPTKYRTARPFCEHCRTNRKRNNTALIQDASGDIKQIGIDCLKEYTGITETDVIKNFIALSALFEEVATDHFYTGGGKEYADTAEYIAECIHEIHKGGYRKSLKNEVFEAARKHEGAATAEEKETAQKVLDYFKNGTFDNDFLHNIHMAAQKGGTLENGLLAYAYIAYQKEIEKAEKRAAAAAEAAKTAYYGNVGDRIKVDVTGRVITSYNTQISYYNYVTTYIYEFKDSENHVFIWKSQKEIPLDDNGKYNGILTGTIKEHSDYKGTKQTVLTRCKA